MDGVLHKELKAKVETRVDPVKHKHVGVIQAIARGPRVHICGCRAHAEQIRRTPWVGGLHLFASIDLIGGQS
ncbi:hypothetical protein Ate02nite_62270 [Paractinoplanes tereljensis]|uniref:Uncharacterized protein n=1 Tax=Paractinoplanes tereljensis TaxID=571912 RepID=A0A919TX34_9ACTN|nr:hypothetical protein Ate02nite_62270 [Actinoplanes tereljensis]